MYTDGHEYTCTHWWYDSEDNDYEVTAVWKFEKGYDIPDSWHLQSVELEDYSDSLPQALIEEIKSGCQHSGSVWCDIESQGPDETDLKEVDYAN